MAPDLDAFAAMAADAVAEFPAPFRVHALEVTIQVEELPHPDMLAELGVEDPLDLTGLYDGTPLPLKSPTDPSPYPDIVWLFRKPILDEWETRPGISLPQLVTHVVVHEFAHHFGWSDADIAAIDPWWE
ncbi:metallopeptidase family protein [uncultured Tateyamaria sp.]|uniref:metallopeptidase family protein n=1 Tax=uncultured Tateyamaria sp. TaxID=455651 RepID=UPI002635D803|nr:metallopeptidase family protein [uncultured Tateyamaria sp.]